MTCAPRAARRAQEGEVRELEEFKVRDAAALARGSESESKSESESER